MSLEVKLVSVNNLKGKYDRFASFMFRGVTKVSKTLENCGSEAKFDELFDWPLSSFLDSDEFMEVRIFNRNKIFHDRLVGGYRMSLASLCTQGGLELVDNLIDDRHQILRNEIKLELRYLKPTPLDFYDRVEELSPASDRSDAKSQRSLHSTVTVSSQPRTNGQDIMEGMDIYHPRILMPKLVNSKVSDFQVHLKIIEAKDLAGMSLDPVVTITVGDQQKKNTTVKPQTNNPFWDEFFVFDFKLAKTKFLDQVMTYQVYTGRSIVSQGSMIGSFKHDLWYIYQMQDHCCFSKWAPLLDGATTECKGYLRLDVGVFGKGDVIKDAPIRKDSDEDIERNLLLPEGVAPFRPVFKYNVKIYKADGIPQMNANLMANVKKAFTGKVQALADPFVEVSFAGMRERTSVVKNSYSPEFNEEIEFTEFFPPLCERIQFQLKDSDAMGEEVVGTHFVRFDEISNQNGSYNDKKDSGFLPSFGPCWINLYGSTRDYTSSDEHLDLNCGLGEGVAYRGRILVAIDCTESEPEDTGRVAKEKNDGPPKDSVGRIESFKLFATFYEASMIPRKIGDKPIQFEVTMGEYGVYVENPAPKETKLAKAKSESQEALDELIDDFIDEDIYVKTLTPPKKPLCPEKKYFFVPFENVKPCTCLKFPFQDQRRRHYNTIMLLKLCRMLEENVEELDERVRLKLPDTYRLLRRVMGDLVHGCSLYFDLADGKKTGTHLGKNRLDRDRLKMCMIELKNISVQAGKIGDSCKINENMEDKVREVHGMLRTLRKLILEPQHGLPDVFVWMLSGSKRVAYARLPAEDILYSKVDFERGKAAGRVQTIFLRLPGKRGHGENGWAIQGKVEMRFWLGLMKHKADYLLDAPGGYEELEDRPMSAPPEQLIYTERRQFVVRAHMYQARSLIGSDDSGLSDAFARVICTNQVQETQVIWKTRSPTWDQMLKFEDIFLWGDPAELAVNPPVIVIEIFDKDEGISTEVEFIGRALARPVVKLACEEYAKPLFPPSLQWFPVIRGEERAGDLLAAFEMLELSDELYTDIPDDPVSVTTPEGVKMRVPDNIRPVMVKHRVEALFWGVREMKRAQLMSINRPQIDIDCCYSVTMLDSQKTSEVVFSTVCKNAKRNPNFDDPVVIFDVDLPDNKKYIPPITFRVNDCRTFGRHILAGSHVIDSLYEYFQDPKKFSRRPKKEEDQGKDKKLAFDDVDIGVMDAVDNKQGAAEADAGGGQKKAKKEQSSKEEEVLDWWTRFYETLRDQEKETKQSRKVELDIFKKGRQNEAKPDTDRIPRIKVFNKPLEDVPEFGGFNDFIRTFPLLRGKKTDDEDDEIRRFSGKVKANLRVWKFPDVPNELTQNEPETTFHRLPSNDPINVLVRVYVIRAMNLHPTDPNGKADPYVSVTLGKKTIKERDSYISKQLNPEFGKCFEFESILPFDNLLMVQVYDWDMIGDDLIGETKLDIENRFYSKHRASCGIQENYMPSGYAQWRDPQKPTQILTKICKDEGFEGPIFSETGCRVNGIDFTPPKATIKDEKGREKPSDEPAALEALRNLQQIPDRGYHLVPEHVETRPLFNPEKPGQEQGKLQLWVDMFPMDLTMPGPAVDVSPRKPVEYELRVIIWNTEDVLPDETNIITGEASSDIFVKGWLQGNREHIQETDVHYRSTDGSGMFNWRFVFPFMFHKAEEKIVTKKKASIFAIDETEEKHPPNLYLQVWDADLFSADDFIGDLILPISRIPAPAKASKLCDLKVLDTEPKGSLIKSKHMKGWWPFQVNPEDDDDPNPILAGKVEAELELLTKEDAEAAPAGKGREEPQPLTKPNRPADSFGLFMSPLKMLRYIFWENYKWCLLKALIVSLLLLIAALFLYSMPGYTVKKIFNA